VGSGVYRHRVGLSPRSPSVPAEMRTSTLSSSKQTLDETLPFGDQRRSLLGQFDSLSDLGRIRFLNNLDGIILLFCCSSLLFQELSQSHGVLFFQSLKHLIKFGPSTIGSPCLFIVRNDRSDCVFFFLVEPNLANRRPAHPKLQPGEMYSWHKALRSH
jgi:hypothetical protein